jgi:hypothetical protein
MAAKNSSAIELPSGSQSASGIKSASDVSGSQSLASKYSEAGTCITCNGQYSAPGWLSCSLCDRVVHTACIAKSYKAAGAEPLRNSIAWLHGLLSSMNFSLNCTSCVTARATRDCTQVDFATQSSQPWPQTALLRQEIADFKASVAGSMGEMMQQLNELKSGTWPIDVHSTSATSPCQADSQSDDKAGSVSSKCKPSCASLFSHSITESVKQAVVAGLVNKENIERDKASVVIYGLRRQNPQDVNKIFDAISVNCLPVTGVRLGKPAADPSISRPRPLKVVFSSQANMYMVLRAARYLRQHQAYRSVTIDKYKSADVMKKLRETRAECQQLNINAGCSTTGRKFIVIDGEIRTKRPDGKLNHISRQQAKRLTCHQRNARTW